MRIKLKKKSIIISVIVLVVAITSIIGYFIYLNLQPKKVTPVTPTPAKASTRVYNLDESNIYGIAYETARNDGYAAGQRYLDDKLKSVNDSKQKSNIYIYKSSLASSEFGNDQESALEFAKNAEKIDKNSGTAQRIAIVYEKLNDKASAIKYYKLYLERLKDLLADYSGDMKTYYEDEYNKYVDYVSKLEVSNN